MKDIVGRAKYRIQVYSRMYVGRITYGEWERGGHLCIDGVDDQATRNGLSSDEKWAIERREMDAYTYVTKHSSSLRSLNNLNIRKVTTCDKQTFHHIQHLCGASLGLPQLLVVSTVYWSLTNDEHFLWPLLFHFTVMPPLSKYRLVHNFCRVSISRIGQETFGDEIF